MADALQAQETGVPLIGMKHLLFHTEQLEGSYPADAEQYLLANPVFLTTTIEAVGDRATLGVVVVDVGVHEIQRDAPHLGQPDAGPQGGAGQIHLHMRLRTISGHTGGHRGRQCHEMGVEYRVLLHLQALGVEALTEVALAIEQTHPGEGNPQGAGRLQVIAGQHTEPTRVLRERLRDTELRGEVRHRP